MLRIDKGSQGGALHSSKLDVYYESYHNTLYTFRKIRFFSI